MGVSLTSDIWVSRKRKVPPTMFSKTSIFGVRSKTSGVSRGSAGPPWRPAAPNQGLGRLWAMFEELYKSRHLKNVEHRNIAHKSNNQKHIAHFEPSPKRRTPRNMKHTNILKFTNMRTSIQLTCVCVQRQIQPQKIHRHPQTSTDIHRT